MNLFNKTKTKPEPKKSVTTKAKIIPMYTAADFLSAIIPEDIVAPRVLTPGGVLVFTGTPKIGKSYLMLSWLMHMAAGKPFLGMTPPRPLKIVYMQADADNCAQYIGERVQRLNFDSSLMTLVQDNLAIFTEVAELDAKGLEVAHRSIRSHFGSQAVDIIALDPLYNVMELSRSGNHEGAMATFLDKTIGKLRKAALNPNAGVILVHQSDKVKTEDLELDPVQGLHDELALRRFYSSCIVMHQPKIHSDNYQLIFELRDGKPIATKNIELVDDKWCEVSPALAKKKAA